MENLVFWHLDLFNGPKGSKDLLNLLHRRIHLCPYSIYAQVTGRSIVLLLA